MNTKKEHILLVSEKLFAEKGYDAVTTREIARSADVNIAMIAYYFGSKEKLYEEVIAYRLFSLDSLTAELELMSNYSSKLTLLLEVLVDKFLERKYFQQIVFRELSTDNRQGLSQKIRLQLISNFSYLAQTIAKGIDCKEFAPVNIPLTLLSILGTLRMYINATELLPPFGAAILASEASEDSAILLKKHLLLIIGNHLNVKLNPSFYAEN